MLSLDCAVSHFQAFLFCYIFAFTGQPSPPRTASSAVVGPGLVSLEWSPSPTYFDEVLTYELHVLKDDTLIDIVPVNKTVYVYSFQEKECQTYMFAVYSVNEVGTSTNSTEISVAVPNGEYTVISYTHSLPSLINSHIHCTILGLHYGC